MKKIECSCIMLIDSHYEKLKLLGLYKSFDSIISEILMNYFTKLEKNEIY